MQRVSDEERMEVAKRLRGIEAVQFDDGELVDCGEVEAELGLASDDGAWYRLEDVLRLADLIEPAPERTCRNEADALNEREGFETYDFVCSECGYNELKRDADRVLCLRLFDLNYCRMCGARVEGAGE